MPALPAVTYRIGRNPKYSTVVSFRHPMGQTAPEAKAAVFWPLNRPQTLMITRPISADGGERTGNQTALSIRRADPIESDALPQPASIPLWALGQKLGAS
ncbi:hypothetical protein SDC9_69384 [bioreactor metagenome]|uniref:Uncharacterized protein n=1 Tax=bioreactor metagenome TaxID=1076179 RepID=A0A644Y9Y0_9ZZZZ